MDEQEQRAIRQELGSIACEFQAILNGEFDGTDAERAAYESAGGDDAEYQKLVKRLDALYGRMGQGLSHASALGG